jgi:hypothetical protein
MLAGGEGAEKAADSAAHCQNGHGLQAPAIRSAGIGDAGLNASKRHPGSADSAYPGAKKKRRADDNRRPESACEGKFRSVPNKLPPRAKQARADEAICSCHSDFRVDQADRL